MGRMEFAKWWRLAFLKVEPEALFLARAEDSYLGYSYLNVRESDGTTLIQGWTGVRPEERSPADNPM